MDMRMLNYLERKFSENRPDERRNEDDGVQENRRGVPNRRRNQIGFNDETENRRMRYAHDFKEDDFKEIKMQKGQSHGKSDGQMSELVDLMEKSFHKEMCDVLRYCEMKDLCEEMGLDSIADGLEELSQDEFMHAKFFKMGLRYLDEEPEKDPELAKLWHKVERKMNKY